MRSSRTRCASSYPLLFVLCWLGITVPEAQAFVGFLQKLQWGRRLRAKNKFVALRTASCPPSPLESSKPRRRKKRRNAVPTKTTNIQILNDEEGELYPVVPVRKRTLTEEELSVVVAFEGQSESTSADSETSPESADSGDDGRTHDEATHSHQQKKRRELVGKAALLGRGNRSRSPRATRKAEKRTSVGARRTGSASRARQQQGSTSKLMDALRKAARANSADEESENKADDSPTSKRTQSKGDEGLGGDIPNASAVTVSSSAIQTAIGDLLNSNFVKNTGAQPGRLMAAVSSLKKSVGRMGEPDSDQSAPESDGSAEETFVRLATPMDDLDIANLRLSVFSDFSFDQRGQFCARSCQAIASRRKRGAVCVVATKGEESRPRIHGTAECSFHEFYGTRLGQRRPRSSILYVTEVAVHPAIRRQGIGSMLLDAIDCFAKRQDIETIYLHVDVCNMGALALYEKCGYQKTEASEPLFEEFTKSLNLHPGATKGRSHFLLFKDIKQPTWLPQENVYTYQPPMIGTLGFEIPA